jgi:D-alanyl-D-alanine carboxypeptidase
VYRSDRGRTQSYISSRQSPRPAQPRRNRRTASLALLAAAVIVVIGITLFISSRDDAKKTNTPSATVPKGSSAVQGSNTAEAGDTAFNNTQYSLTDPKSLWVIVNKKHKLDPTSYTPANLAIPSVTLRANITSNEKYVRGDMAAALQKMINDAAAQGINFNLQSGYRSHDFQASLYNGYVRAQGQAVADRQSARPGHSEHQTGLAADLGGTTRPSCDVEACFADTEEGKWLAANGYKYGFIIRYPADKESVTGYLYEPWHIRYVGTELSNEMHNRSIGTLEEFFNVTGGTSY